MHRAALQVKPHAGADRTGGKEPHGTEVVEAIQGAPDSIIGKGLRGYGLAQEEFGVLMGEELFSAGERAPTAQRISDQPKHDRARVHIHRCGHGVIDKPDEAELVSIGFDNWQVVDRIDFDGGWDVQHGVLSQGTLAACSVLAA